jgi:hypothetical protein
MAEAKRPRLGSSLAEQELDKAQEQLDAFEQSAKSITLDVARSAPLEEKEPQTLMSRQEIKNSQDIYLKPARSISSKEKFNEKFRDEYNYFKEYVQFIADSNEIKGESIEFWTKDFPGVPAEFWQVPPGRPVWAPRYVERRINACKYSRWKMEDRPTETGSGIQYYGAMKVETIVKRLEVQSMDDRKYKYRRAA